MKKFSQEFSKTESKFLGALSKLDDFLQNPEVRVPSGTVPGTSRNMNVENQEPTEDCSEKDASPEIDAPICRFTQPLDSHPEETSYTHC